jgi:mercuric-ion-binding periplasmic protein merP
MQTVTLNIDGMTCGGCVKSVTRLLEGVEGVEKAEDSLENKNAVITFDESKTDTDALIDAVEDGGYDVAL